MKVAVTLKRIIFAGDFGLALVVVVAMLFLVPSNVNVNIAKDIFEISVSVLSIVFSIFFAGLAILITAGDNEFVRFLEEDGSYRSIVWSFKFTLFVLFCALLFAIVLFASVLPFSGPASQYIFPKWLLIAFGFSASYSLFAVFSASLDAIKYAEYRVRFIKIVHPRDNNPDT
jgi:hypothetical protein